MSLRPSVELVTFIYLTAAGIVRNLLVFDRLRTTANDGEAPAMSTSPKPPPRPADLAITVNTMLSSLLRRIWEIDYKQLSPDMGTCLVLMMLHFRISIATGEGHPLTHTELARVVRMAPTTVRSYVAILEKHNRVKLIAGRKRGRGHEQVIITNLDRLDDRITIKHTKFGIETIETCLNELKLLSTVLLPQLIANGKQQAAE